jgi:hypothetical protein
VARNATFKGLFGSNRNFKWPLPRHLHRTLFRSRNYSRWLAARSCTYRTFIAATSRIRYQSLLTMGKDRARWNNITGKDVFMIQHLLKATRQGKKSDSGFKKEVWFELQRNFKFGIRLAPKQFQTRGQTVICIISKASREIQNLSNNCG